MNPLISIIIVHYGEVRYFTTCLNSIRKSTYKSIEIIVVDNNPQPLTEEMVAQVDKYVHDGNNYGFAEACNIGIGESGGEFVFILNNDIRLDEVCLERLVMVVLKDKNIAVLQPKMLDMKEERLFHSSAAGGMLDIFGYPFARGRIFDNAEIDDGQYNDSIGIFWCSGAALFARKSILEEAGLFDRDFFLYMEEIDIQWRIHLLGYKIIYIPDAIIYHEGAPTLDRHHISRMYFVHRNSLIMLLKYLPFGLLYVILLCRFFLELFSIVVSALVLDFKRPVAILKALRDILISASVIRKKRVEAQNIIRVPFRDIYNKMYHGSIVMQFFLLGKNRFSELSIPVKHYRVIFQQGLLFIATKCLY